MRDKKKDINNLYYIMKKNDDMMIQNLYSYSPYTEKTGILTSVQERKKNTDAPLTQEEQIAMNYDWNESIRSNVELLKEKGIDVSKSTLGRWLKKQKENKNK